MSLIARQQAEFINAFLNGGFCTTYEGTSFNFTYNETQIFAGGLLICERTNKGIFVNGSHPNIVLLLNMFEGIEASQDGNGYNVNGLQWDGNKTNLEIFI